ncbi:MAG: phenylalanine--tRNA ligase subunit alpha, partial [Bacteroidaceae bacterium]|nr:phenylalanine--tRNA ligase subunit alpha [Bacteroidaceae bacterium]
MLERISNLLGEIQTLSAADEKELEALRIKYLSKKGLLNDLMADFRNVPGEQKREVGMRINELKTALQEKLAELRLNIATSEDDLSDLDLTRTAYPVKLGTRHPLSLTKREIIDIFARLGFAMAEGPEVEDDWHVFGSMNFADDHPARDMQDTFFIEARPDIILRTHTSSVQSRVMEQSEPPIRVICPGRVYRN